HKERRGVAGGGRCREDVLDADEGADPVRETGPKPLSGRRDHRDLIARCVRAFHRQAPKSENRKRLRWAKVAATGAPQTWISTENAHTPAMRSRRRGPPVRSARPRRLRSRSMEIQMPVA